MEGKETDFFGRTELLMGGDYMRNLSRVRVIVFGVGGVGSWCVEALVRSGVRRITLVDSDQVCASNVNRQLMATSKTLGRLKVDVLKQRLLEINPAAEVEALPMVYQKETAEQFHLEQYDYIVDAIDSLKDKICLILQATRLMRECRHVTFFSSMGAALRIDPLAVSKAEFWEVQGDPLARMLRKRFKSMHEYPAHKFLCVYSTELPRENRGEAIAPESVGGPAAKARINGTMAAVTMTFGVALASLVTADVEKKMSAAASGSEAL